jgi:hypothetical protein
MMAPCTRVWATARLLLPRCGRVAWQLHAPASTHPVVCPHRPCCSCPPALPDASTGWVDFGVLLVLQFANATVGYIEERNAGDAIDALKKRLAPQSHVCRGGV